MPGTVPPPPSGIQGFWNQIQQLAQRLTSLEAWVRTPRMTRGVATLTFTASATSAILVVAHGLPGVPAVVLATSAGGGFPVCDTFTYTASQFSLNAQLPGSFTGTLPVAWIAAL